MIDKPIKKKRNQESNRLTLSDKAQEKAKVWLSQINKEFNGMLNLKRNDLLNFLLEEMEENLSKHLMDKIKDQKLTDKEKAKWIYQKFLEAEKQGLELNFSELVKTAQGPTKRTKKPRREAKKASHIPAKTDSQSTALTTRNINNIK